MASNAPTPPTTSGAIVARLANRLGMAWLLSALAAASIASIVSQPVLVAAAWASVPVLVGLFAGLVFLGAALPVRNLEPSFAVVGAGLGRLITGVLAGVVVQGLTGVDDRSFWLAFVAVMGAVMAAEVVVVSRVLASAPRQEASRA